jgi:transposase
VRRDEVEAIGLAGGEPAGQLVLALLDEVVLLRERVEELERRLGQNSGNSSKPPSSDPPASRAERRRLAREAYKRSMRKSGGQPGHEGKTRELVARERLDKRVEHLPDCCGCGHVFDGSEERVADPVCHQQFELPPVRPLVFEHARVRLRCPACQKATLAQLSAGALSGFGPRIDAHIAMLAGVFRLSRDQVRQTCQGSREFPRCDHGNSPSGARPVSAGRSAAMASRWRRMR